MSPIIVILVPAGCYSLMNITFRGFIFLKRDQNRSHACDPPVTGAYSELLRPIRFPNMSNPRSGSIVRPKQRWES